MEILRQKNKVILFIIALVFVLYGNTIRNSYALDDDYVTVTNPGQSHHSRVEKGIKGIPQIFTSHYVEIDQQSFEYRPMVLVTFAIEHQFFGSNPHISHFINVMLYAITCVIVFLVLSRILKAYHLLFPFAVTILFIVHPIHTEVVASIKNRDELLSFLFGMLALYYTLKGVDSSKKIFFMVAMLCFFIAMLSKATSVLFLVAIPATLYFFTSVKLKRLGLILLLFVGVFLSQKILKHALVDSNSSMREFAFFENPLFYNQSVGTYIVTALNSLGYYVRLFFIPYPLCSYYGYNTVPVDQVMPLPVIISVVFHLALLVYLFRNISKKTALAYGIVFYFTGLVFFSNVVTPVAGIIGERFVYFASLGFCLVFIYILCLVLKVDLLNPSGKKPVKSPLFIMVSAMILITASVLTIARNAKWKDEVTLFRNDVKHYDNSCNLHYILANKLYSMMMQASSASEKSALSQESLMHYKRAGALMAEGVKAYPEDHTTWNNVGTIYVDVLNDPVSATPCFRQALQNDPGNVVTQYNYAFCYEKRNMNDSAIYYYQRYVTAGTSYIPVYIRLRELYIRRQDYANAIACDKQSVARAPSEARLHINLGNSYLLGKDTLQAVGEFKEAVRLEPANTELRKQIINFFTSSGYHEEADQMRKSQPSL